MDLNNITAEQQKGLEFLKVRFQSELDDIKSKIVQLNKPFPDDLTTHLQNSFLNKELLFSPSQQIGLKKDQRKDQLEKLKGDENERQYLGRIKLSLERFAEAGMRQDLENKLLGIVQNSKLTSNKRMSAFFCLMHSLGFGFKRTSDFVQWAFGQMWVYENRRIAKDRKLKMKKNKEGSSSKPDKKSKQDTQNDMSGDESEQQQQQQQDLQDNKETMQKIEDINGQNYGQESNQLKQQGLDGDMLPKFNLSQGMMKEHSNLGQAANSDLSLHNNMNMFNNNQQLQLNEQDLQQNQINGDKKDGNSQDILQAQLNLHQLIQVKLNAKIKSLEEQNDEKALQIQQLLNLCENSKNAFQGFLINLFPLLQNLNVSPDIVTQVQNLARQHQYVNANRRVGDPANLDPELQNIIGGNRRNNNNNNNGYDILGQGFMDMHRQNKFETKVEHINNQNQQHQEDRLNNSNHQSSQHIPQNQQSSFNQFNQQNVNQHQQNNQQHQQQHLQQNQQQLSGIGNNNQFLLGQNNFGTSLNGTLNTFGNQNLLMQNNFSNTLPMQNNFGLHGQDLNLGNQFQQDLLQQQQVLQNHQDGLK